MNLNFFKIDVQDGIANLRMDRPQKANAMNGECWKELPWILNDMNAEGKVRVCILSGEGRHFSSGMDTSFFARLETVGTGTARNRELAIEMISSLQAALGAMENARFPVIAAVHGACIGGALDMIAACDLRFASTDARFSIEEINIGMMADMGSLQRLPYLIHEGILREYAFTGDVIDAERALEIGLVNKVFENHGAMMEGVGVVAKKIAKKSPLAISASKRALNFSRNHGLQESLNHAQVLQAAFSDLDDVKSAIKAKSGQDVEPFKDLTPFGSVWVDTKD